MDPSTPSPAAQAKPEPQEIATIARSHLHQTYDGILRPDDDVLLARGSGKGLRIYDELERDPKVAAYLHKRKMALLARPVEVLAASTARLDQKAADTVRAQIEALDFDAACMNLLDALLKGFSVGELMWQLEGREVRLERVLARDQRRFVFTDAGELRLLTKANQHHGEALPPGKFLTQSFGAKDGNPYGLGLGHKLFWPVKFKREDIGFWLRLGDKHGLPTPFGKYPAGTPAADQAKLLQALSAIARDGAIIAPDTTLIELIEAKAISSDLHERIARYMDEEIGHVILGEAPSGKDSGGALASAAILRNTVRLELVQADSDLLSGGALRQMAHWITFYNVPGAKPPTIKRKVVEPEDRKARVEADKILFGMGYRPAPDYIAETYGAGWTLGTAKPPPAGNGQGEETSFAEADLGPEQTYADQAALDRALGALPPAQLQAALARLTDPLQAIVKRGGTPEELLTQFAQAYPQMDATGLTELLGRALFVADIWGMVADPAALEPGAA